MLTLPSFLFYMHCIVALGAALAGSTITFTATSRMTSAAQRGARTSVACFLLSMSSLAGILILLGAHVVAIAQLIFCAGLGLVYFFVIEGVGAADVVEGTRARVSQGTAKGSWQWLIIILGIAFASAIGRLLFDILPSRRDSTEQLATFGDQQGFEVVGIAVLIDQGIALIGVGLLLLAALIGAGFLARRGLD